MDINKHRKIAYILHSINLILLLAGGFLIFVISQAFIACAGSPSPNAEFTCTSVLLVCFGIPAIIGAIPLFCLKSKNKISKIILYIYSVLIALVFFPVGTAIGVHTIYYLNNLDINA